MKTCTIIPVHPPYYHFAKQFLQSFELFVDQSHEIYFVLHNKNEEEFFRDSMSPFKNFKLIILPEELQNRKNLVNAKKLHAMEKLHSYYDYIGVYDSEVAFVRNCDLDEIYKEIGERTSIKANSTLDAGKQPLIITASKLGLDKNETLLDHTENLSLYWWFNEIPVYKTSLFKEFLEWLKFQPNYEDIVDES
jgi:hypothetical protein